MNEDKKQTIAKLVSLVWNKFGVELNVFALSNLNEIEKQIDNDENPDLYIPLKISDIYLGTAVAINARNLEIQKKEMLTDTVRLILEPLFYHQAQNLMNKDTVVSIDDSVLNIDGSQNFLKENPKFIFLKSAALTRARNAVITIHDLLDNWSLLDWQDIKEQIKNADDFSSIQGATIYVNLESEKISESELSTLQLNKDCTLIFYGSKNSVEDFDLKETKSSVLYLDLDKIPLDKSKETDALSMFLSV